MLNIKYIKNNLELILNSNKKRRYKCDIKKLLQLEHIRKNIKMKIDYLKNIRKKKFILFNKYKSQDIKIKKITEELKNIKTNIKKFEIYINNIKKQIEYIISNIPNVIHKSVPFGISEQDNQELYKQGNILKNTFKEESHEKVKSIKNLLDLETPSRISRSRFMILHRSLAKMHRALINFMLDTHIKRGYKEIYVPYMVNSKSLYGTSQLPKFYNDLFKVEKHDLWLIPTSEVSVTNIMSNQIIKSNILPLKFVCHSPCFRSEAGSYGKDKTGIFRQHQFEKVELVQFVEEDKSYDALENIKKDAEYILKLLDLPYRVVNLCSGDIGFGASKTYDIEVWLPSQKKYKEISSCSNFGSFQTQRMNSKYIIFNKKKYLHTLNASGLSVGRTLIAIIENYQDGLGNIKIPEVLKK